MRRKNMWKTADILLALSLLLMETGCASASKQSPCDRRDTYCPSRSAVENPAPATKKSFEAEDSGIQVVSLRLTAAGHMLDLRYRIIDAEKASPIFDRQNEAYLVDEATGAKMTVPRMAKVGPLRQTNFTPDPNRVYFILFGNSGGIIQSGSHVTLEIGDCTVRNLIVQ